MSPIQQVLNNLAAVIGVWALICYVCGYVIYKKEQRFLEDTDLTVCVAVASTCAVIVFVVLTIMG